MRSLQLTTWLYLSAYRTAERFLIRTGLWDSNLRRAAARLDRLILRLWLGRTVPDSAIVYGHRIHFPPHYHKAFPIIVSGRYELATTRLLQRTLRPGMNVVDVGAHIGYYTLLFSRAVSPDGHVYAFEPQPDTVDLLTRNLRTNGYSDIVTVIPKAVSDRPAKATLYMRDSVGASTSLYRSNPGKISGTAEVNVTSLDEYFASIGWPQVDLVKIDIEGAEKTAVEGMIELCRRNRAMKLIMEFGLHHLAAAGTTPVELLESLSRCGFTKYSVVDDECVAALSMPTDLDTLIRMSYQGQAQVVNLLCERG